MQHGAHVVVARDEVAGADPQLEQHHRLLVAQARVRGYGSGTGLMKSPPNSCVRSAIAARALCHVRRGVHRGTRRRACGAARGRDIIERQAMAIIQFPDPRTASPEGIVAIGGDLHPDSVLAAYRQGIFPWPVEKLPLLWFCPAERGVLDLAAAAPAAQPATRATHGAVHVHHRPRLRRGHPRLRRDAAPGSARDVDHAGGDRRVRPPARDRHRAQRRGVGRTTRWSAGRTASTSTAPLPPRACSTDSPTPRSWPCCT